MFVVLKWHTLKLTTEHNHQVSICFRPCSIFRFFRSGHWSHRTGIQPGFDLHVHVNQQIHQRQVEIWNSSRSGSSCFSLVFFFYYYLNELLYRNTILHQWTIQPSFPVSRTHWDSCWFIWIHFTLWTVIYFL